VVGLSSRAQKNTRSCKKAMLVATFGLVSGFTTTTGTGTGGTGRSLNKRVRLAPVACDSGLGLHDYEMPREDGLATIKFCLEGSHVTSWVCGGEEQLFLSKKASFIPEKLAIRGGIPICWPTFNERNLKAGKHGIVRTSERWNIHAADTDPDGTPWMVLEHETFYLEVDAKTGTIVGYHYEEPSAAEVAEAVVVPSTLRMRYEVKPTSLRVEMQVENGGDTAFDFSTVMHSYFSVNQMPVTVRGLQGKSGLKDGEPFTDDADEVLVDGDLETQRLYQDVDGAVSWETPATNGGTKKLTLTKSANLPDVVLWNAGEAGARGIGDLEDGGHLRYLCVEPGICESVEASVGAGETWVGWQEIAVEIV
jgi:glucose-6-phosphate 1-epimerase